MEAPAGVSIRRRQIAASVVALLAVTVIVVAWRWPTTTGSPGAIGSGPVVGAGGSGTATVTASSTATPRTVPPSTATGPKPNLLVIMVDDETTGQLAFMPNVKKLLVDQGTSFSRYYTTTPNCCPSRAGFYSGQYPHNNGVKDNEPPLGGAQKFAAHQGSTLPVWLKAAGYTTAQIGKYLNGWGNPASPDKWQGGIDAPPGWDHWFGLIDPTTYQYYCYSVSVNGQKRDYGTAPADYQTDVLGREVVDTVTRDGKKAQPWFVMWTPLAPHVGKREGSAGIGGEGGGVDGLLPVPGPTHENQFANEPLYTAPSQAFNGTAEGTADLQGKPPFVRKRVANLPATQQYMAQSWRAELETVQSVDDWVGTIHETLRSTGQLDHTVIAFVSDNGTFHGEHGLYQKGLLYEEATRVPLVIAGPGFAAGSTSDQMALNLDLTATLVGLAGATPGQPLDGRDLRPQLGAKARTDTRGILLETWYFATTTTTQAIRQNQWSMIRWSTGELELYDLATDPYQMKNLATDPAFAVTLGLLTPRLDKLSSCAGATCEQSVESRPG